MTDEPEPSATSTALADAPAVARPVVGRDWPAQIATLALLVLAAIFFALHFLHLQADFPNHSPWVDWSKYTDEGWYGDAAIRHYLTGHWYWKGDFNPAVALPVWPALELVVFKFTGVSAAAARALTLCVFALTLVALYALIRRHSRTNDSRPDRHLAAPLTIFLLCASPFVYVFERMAILEPLLIALAVLALLAASHLQPLQIPKTMRPFAHWKIWSPTLVLALLLPALVLTKTTAICLLPSIAYMIWARAGYRIRAALRLAAIPAVLGAGLWCAYFFLFVRPHYLADYRYLFSANAYTGVELQPFATTVLNTLTDGFWIGKAIYLCFFAVLGVAIFWRPRLFANPLFPSLLLWIGGYVAFLVYHNNLQPRYYLVLAIPITAIVALGLDAVRQPLTKPGARRLDSGIWVGTISIFLAAAVVLAIAVPDALLQLDFILHPTYQFEAAAQGIKRIVLADKQQSHLILSISGSDLTLMTGLPSIDDDFGTLELGERVREYHPGWFATWNEVDDDKADALTPLYHLQRVAAFPAMDDPDRNLLILYRLDTASQAPASTPRQRKRLTPRQLVTRIGQQPSTSQLQH
jgi:hypothetical protein